MVPEPGFEPGHLPSQSRTFSPIKLLRKKLLGFSKPHCVISAASATQSGLAETVLGRTTQTGNLKHAVCCYAKENHHSTQPKHSPLTIIKNWLHHFALYCGALFGLIRDHWSLGLFRLSCAYPQDAIWAPCSALKLHGGKLQTRFIRRSLHPNFIGCPEAHFESSGSLRLVVFSLFKGTRKYLAGFRLAASKPTSSMISCQRTWCPHSDLNRERALIWSHGVPTYKVGVLPVKL